MSAYSRNAVFDAVKTAIVTAFPTAYVTAMYEFAPPSFPCVFVRETGHTTVSSAQTFGNGQKVYDSTFEVQIFSNDDAPLSQAYSIYDTVEAKFKSLYYVDVMGAEPVDNADPKIFRLVAKFRKRIGGADAMPE